MGYGATTLSSSDARGIGAVADPSNRTSHAKVIKVLDLLDRLEHRGAIGARDRYGAGAGILQVPDEVLRAVVGSGPRQLPSGVAGGAGRGVRPRKPTSGRTRVA